MEMMPSPNLDHTYQDFHDLNWCISSHEWIHQSLMNFNVQTSNCNEHLRGLLNQREVTRPSNPIEPPALNPSLTLSQVMAQDLGFQGCIRDNDHINQQGQEAAQSQYLPRIKEEISRETLPKLFGGSIHDHYRMIDEKLLARAFQNSSHNLLLPSMTEDLFVSNGSSINGFVNSTSCDNSYNTALSTVNTSSLYSQPLLLPGILDMDLYLHGFDVLDASRPKPFMMREEEEEATFGPTTILMQQLAQGTCTNHPKIRSSLSGVAEKRGVNNSILDSKTAQCHQAIHRKSRLEPRSPPFSSFKVRKEKLGDRIAALQQLVAPFGKTDTASVLMEAIGYIKFLQDQVETLSVPYLRLSKNKKQRTTQGEASEIEKEAKVDLRSRGLCLVPLSCTSYVTNENGGVWSSPNFRGSV